ncbi:hypothetical protein F4861DRAFT_520522 [Xylaria intraflava]|nr:hypothetical protein F4861DRAFT_520522 [Xylaria intraflava]
MTDPELAEPISGAEDRSISTSKVARHAPRKRRRIVISCSECHRRKQKCDRKLPCTNCQSRNRHSSCRYESGTPIAKADPKAPSSSSSSPSNTSSHDRLTEPPPPPPPLVDSKPAPVADFGYSDSASTLGVLHKIENAAGTSLVPGEPPSEESYEMRERYKSLIRQLPARTYVERLVDLYLHEVNWQYPGIDGALIKSLMEQWSSLPFHVLSGSGPVALDPMLRALPALLFQMIACSLLYLPPACEKDFESLKYTGNMTFDDLAIEYSEAGTAILTLLGKRQMSIITVLAGWVRASLLKFTGMVTEAWHQIGTTIRDAQGIGLHRDQMDPQPRADDSSEEAVEKLWRAQHRRTVWLILVAWDLHMGAVLGRPTSIDYRLVNRSFPIDARMAQNTKRVPLVPRMDDDPPTPLTRSMWYWQVMKILRDIQDLEKEGPFPKDFTKVESIQAKILETQACTPPPFRLENSDTRFDHLPECWWLPYARAQLPQLHAFNILALHRPYVFTRAASRDTALQASLEMLESQRQQFATLETAQHRTYNLFFGTFDAVVMVASIYILFPKEHSAHLNQARQHFQWAVERFETMAERNHLARSALGVLQAIWLRFKKAVGPGLLSYHCKGRAKVETEAASRWFASQSQARISSPSVPPSASTHEKSATPAFSFSTQATPSTDTDTPLSSNKTGPGPSPPTAPSENSALVTPEWSLPADIDFSMIMPMYPMGDVAYNDLTGGLGTAIEDPFAAMGESESSLPDHAPQPPPVSGSGLELPDLHAVSMGQEQAPLQFGGEFGTDTIWNILNQFPS